MIFDCPLAGGAGSFVVVAGAEAAENSVSQLEGFVVWALEVLWLRVLCSLGLKVLGVNSWLIL